MAKKWPLDSGGSGQTFSELHLFADSPDQQQNIFLQVTQDMFQCMIL